MKSRLKRMTAGDWAVTVILTIWGLAILYPFYNAVLVSIVPQTEYARRPFMLFPHSITMDTYEYMLSGSRVLTGYKNTLTILLLGLPYNILLTILTAFALSRPQYPGKRFFVGGIYFTMFFSGGLIPLYLVMRNLNLTNSLLSVILLMGINTFYLILTRTYFESLPESVLESARLDGCNELQLLARIVVPLSAPIIATIVLFYAVDRWNEWFYAMLFIKDGDKTPLQMVLRNIIFQEYGQDTATAAGVDKNSAFNDAIKMAAIVMAMAPIMLVYPFVQKYFVKGMLIGAVKS